MPKVLHGIFLSLILTITIYGMIILSDMVAGHMNNVMDKIDDLSISETGKPAKNTEMADFVNNLLSSNSVLLMISVFGVMLVYFLHMKRR